MNCSAAVEGIIVCESDGSLLQTGAIIISALAAVGLIYYTQLLTRKRATIDLVLQQQQNTILLEAEEKFYKLQKEHQANGSDTFTRFACDPMAEENKFILTILNSHEFAASGIRDQAFEEKVYKRMMCNVLIKDWDSLHGYVTEFRSRRGLPTLFKEFEWLATRWKKDKAT